MKQQFSDVTGCPLDDLSKWLEKHNWTIETAIDAYLSHKSNSTAKVRKQDPKVVEIYNRYKDLDDESIIGIEGTLKYIEDLGFDPEDSITLVLAHFLEAPSMGVFYKDKFVQIWSRNKINSISAMKRYIEDDLYVEFRRSKEYFKKVYDFTFGFLMENPGQKLLPYDLAIDYWKLLLLGRSDIKQTCGVRLEQWFKFIETEYQRGFSRDTWQMFLPFVEEIILDDPEKLSKYDEMAAWPSVVDEYIEYLRENELLD